MQSTGERYIPETDPAQIEAEHLSRYHLACLLLDIDSKTVLDIACGTGYGTALLAQKAAKVYGIDISQEAIDYAQERYQRDNITYLKGDCLSIPLENDSVDRVVSFETIEHIDDHEQFLREIKRVLHPDGVLILSSPNKHLYQDIKQTNNPYHIHELHPQELVSLIEGHFAHHAVFGQNYLLGSIIYPMDGVTYAAGVSDITSDPLVPKEPMYNIVIASDKDIHLLHPHTALTYETADTLENLLLQQQNAGYERCRKTPSFRIGHAILHPLHWLKRNKKHSAS